MQVSTKIADEKILKLIEFQITDALNGKPNGKNNYTIESEPEKTCRLTVRIDRQPDDKRLIKLEVGSIK